MAIILPVEDENTTTAETTHVLVCVECGSDSLPKARGWRAYRLDSELLIYCPVCAVREFDDFD